MSFVGRILLNSGSSILFSIPQEPLSKGLAIKIQFRYKCEIEPDGSDNLLERKAGAGVIVGTKTAGKMLPSRFFSVGKTRMLQLPIADYRSCAGTRVEGRAVSPDIEVEGGDAAAGDAVLTIRMLRDDYKKRCLANPSDFVFLILNSLIVFVES